LFFSIIVSVIFLFLFNQQQIGIYNPIPKDTVCKFNLMESEASFSGIALTVFNERNCQLWTMCMEVYLEALDKWEGVEECYEIPVLTNNSALAQIKVQKQKKTKKAKSKVYLFVADSTAIFTRIMSLKSTMEL